MEQKFTKNVKAYIQILPDLNECWEDIKILNDNKTIFVRSTQDFRKGNVNVVPNYWIFETDGVLYNLDQNNIFNSIVKEPLRKAIMGTDLLIFAYGQTGTGKSSTLNGLHNNYEERGLTPRIITELFNLKNIHKHESKIDFSMSYVEICKAYISDLFNKTNNKIAHNPYKNVEIINIKSETDGLRLLFQGEIERSMCYNAHISNKYTSVLTIHVRNLSRLISNPVEHLSKIHIIDMAGIDAGGNTNCEWKSAQEVGMANLNKSQLEQCITTIHMDIMKFRESIKDAGLLVDYLGQSLAAHNIIKFIGHIRTTRKDLPVTLSTLRFANLVRLIKSAKLKPVVEMSPDLVIKNLQHEVQSLKHQMYLNSMLMNNDLSFNITQSRIQQTENAVDDYIRNKSNDLVLLNITDVRTAMNIFKEICTKLAQEINEIKKQIPIERASMKTTSKGSMDSAEQVEDKVSRMSKTARSRDSLGSTKKRKSERSSKLGKLSTTQHKSRTNAVGSVSKSEITPVQLMSYEYEGDIKKSLKLKQKRDLKPSIETITEEISAPSARLSEINLHTELGDDFEDIWNTYKVDESYKFENLNNTLIETEKTTKQILDEFYEQLHKLKNKVQAIDLKKNDLLKIELFKATSIKCGSIDTLKLNESQEEIAIKVIDLINDTINIKEQLLKLQAEMKINIDEYHRLKQNMMKDFTEFCVANYKIQMPTTNQIIECIEDKLNTSGIRSTDKQPEENQQKSVFDKFQLELKRIQKLRKRSNKNK